MCHIAICKVAIKFMATLRILPHLWIKAHTCKELAVLNCDLLACLSLQYCYTSQASYIVNSVNSGWRLNTWITRIVFQGRTWNVSQLCWAADVRTVGWCQRWNSWHLRVGGWCYCEPHILGYRRTGFHHSWMSLNAGNRRAIQPWRHQLCNGPA